MTDLQILYGQWGELAVFLICLGEFVGVPIAAAPLLVLAGAVASQAGSPFWAIPLFGTAGGLLGDLLWYLFAMRRSRTVVDRACGLTSNPWACVTFVRREAIEAGPSYFLFAHFLPGVGNLIAAAAGLAGIRLRRFLALDAVGLVLWATAWSGLGWVLSLRLAPALPLLESNLFFTAVAGLVLMLLAGAWRVHKVRVHKGLHVRDGRAR